MPNYYNPLNFYPATYQSPVGYSGVSQPVMPAVQQPVQQQNFVSGSTLKAMEWVEGEVGAKAYQMPQGWPANQPIPLWDSTDTNIYVKSWSPMGFPNPIQKLHYTMTDPQNMMTLPQGQSGENNGNPGMSGTAAATDMSQFVTKDDLNEIRQEIRNLMSNAHPAGNSGSNQNGSTNAGNQGNNGNRGGNR